MKFFRKNLKTIIIGTICLVIGILIAGGIVYAYTYSANEISYNSTDVASALDELYNQMPKGTINISKNGEYNVSQYAKAYVNLPESSLTGNVSNQITSVNFTSNIYSQRVDLNITVQKKSTAEIKGYIVYCNDKLTAVSNEPNIVITGLSKNTNYKILCKVFDQNGDYSSKEVNIKTKNKVYNCNNQYAIITGDGVKNKKYVNAEDSTDYYYELDLNYNESIFSADAIKKNAYDGNTSTLFQYRNGNLANSYILIDKTAWGKTVTFKTNGAYHGYQVYNSSNGSLYSNYNRATLHSFTIPQNAVKMIFYCNEGGGCYEITIK